MSSVKDFLFGGESTKGIKFQRADNERRQEFIEQQLKQGREDVLNIFPKGQEALQQGYRAAVDVARRAPATQLNVLRDASQQAQEVLYGGMDEYRRAIMGLPTRLNKNPYRNPAGMRPTVVGKGAGVSAPFKNSEQPAFLEPGYQTTAEAPRLPTPQGGGAAGIDPNVFNQALAQALAGNWYGG